MNNKMVMGMFVIIGILLTVYLKNTGAISFAPYAKREDEKAYAMVETYNSQNQIEQEYFYKKPQKIIAIWQGPIETLLTLGQSKNMIASMGIPNDKYIDEYMLPKCREGYRAIPNRMFRGLNQEVAISLNPDFIITSWASAFSKRSNSVGTTDYWHSRGVKTYICEIPPVVGGKRTIEHECKTILDLGKIFKVENQANEIVEKIQNTMFRISEMTKNQTTKPRVMILQYSGKNLINWGSEYLQADIVERLNGEIVNKNKGIISREELIFQNPDIVFLMVNEFDYGNEKLLRKRFTEEIALNSLKCIKNKRVYLLYLYESQYSAVRTIEGINTIAQGMYPELFTNNT